MLKLTAAFLETNPQALVFYGQPTRVMELRLEALPEAAKLPRFSYYSVRTVVEPVMPVATDFPKFGEGQSETGIDDDAFAAALQTYESNLTAHQNNIAEGKILTGLFVRESQISAITFHTEARAATAAYHDPASAPIAVTNKALEDALNQGSATVEMVNNHEETCKRREARNQELDREKVFARIHEQFKQLMKNGKNAKPSDRADIAAARFLIYSLLDGEQRTIIMKRLFHKKRVGELKFKIIFEKFAPWMNNKSGGWYARQCWRAIQEPTPKMLPLNFCVRSQLAPVLMSQGLKKNRPCSPKNAKRT